LRHEKSSEQTAKVVGVSARKVEQARTVLSDPEEKVLVLQGHIPNFIDLSRQKRPPEKPVERR